ncbi:MAG: hypothetical protein Q9217_001389 [Psora testacea]
MSNYGPPPSFGAAYNQNASTAPPRGYGYPSIPQYTYQQQTQSAYMQAQAQPSVAVPAQHMNTYAYGSNARGGRPPTYSNGTGPLAFTSLGSSQAQSARHPPPFPTCQDGPYGPSPFAALPPTQPMVSSFQAIPHNSPSSSDTRPQTQANGYHSPERVMNKPHRLEQDLEDGEVSSRGFSEGGNISNPNTHVPEASQLVQRTGSNPEPKLDSHQLAHNLVREMHSWGLSFQDFVNEGMDVDTLRRIYLESNLPMVTTATRPHRPLAEPQLVSVSNDPTDALVKKTADLPPAALQGQIQEPEMTVPGGGASETPQVTTQSIVEGVVAEQKPMDRKALIAQKLAAKKTKATFTSKAIVVTSIGNSGRPPPIGSELLSPKLVTSASASVSEKEIAAPLEITKHLPEPQPDIEAKRKAQTELARQRMEALKQKATTKEDQPPLSPNCENKSILHALDTNVAPTTNILPDLETVSAGPPVEAPSRKASYFSSVSQSSMFNIPGLFPAAGPMSQEKPHEASTRTIEDTMPTSYSRSSTQPITMSKQEQQPNPSSSSRSIRDAPEGATGQVSRKRQRASDFLDSPPSRVKRPLAQDDAGVVIDISDEEEAETDDDFDMTMGGGQDRNPLSSREPRFGAGEKHMAMELQPMVDFPTRRLPGTGSAAATPSAILTPGKLQEPELKTKEMEIELMNRKIVELEQRIKAKHAASRTQSPGAAVQATISYTPIDLSVENADDPIEDQKRTQAQKTASEISTVTRQVDLATEEDLLAEENQERGLASVEAEIQGPERYHDTPHECQPAEGRPMMRSSTGAEEASDHDNRLIDDSSQRWVQSQDELSIPMQTAPEEPPENAEVSLAGASTPDAHNSSSVERQGQLQQQDEAGETMLHAHRQSRKAELESGLPMLDEEIEKTKQKLQSLREQEAHLEAEIQKGMNGRQMLLDELNRLSQVAEVMEFCEDVDDGQQENTPQTPLCPEGGDPQSPSGIATRSISPNYREAVDPSLLQPVPNQSQFVSNHSSRSQESLHSDADLEEDVMDISRSDLDEGEVIEPLPELNANDDTEEMDDGEIVDTPSPTSPDDRAAGLGAGEVADNSAEPAMKNDASVVHEAELAEEMLDPGPMDGSEFEEEIYEPPRDIPALQANVRPRSTVRTPISEYSLSSIDENGESSHQQDVANRTLALRSGNESGVPSSDYVHGGGASFDNTGPAFTNEQADEQVTHHAQAQDAAPLDDNTDDDYEPPDTMPLDGRVQKYVADPTGTMNSLTAADSYDEQSREPSQRGGHFKPYESPLKHFKSYRFHPEYISEVPSGFRSLTYSHAIDAEVPICPYDLGGTCNDPSCGKQHFRDMGISANMEFLRVIDDVILRELAKPEGTTPPEQDAFVKGLRELILDLRNRKVGGMSDIASAITMYRKNFLADDSRVLSIRAP